MNEVNVIPPPAIESTGLREVQRTRREHREMVEAPRRNAAKLREFGRFLGDVQKIVSRKPGQLADEPTVGTQLRSPNIKTDEKEKLLDRVESIGGDRQLAEALLFGEGEAAVAENRFLLAQNQALFDTVGLGEKKFLTINTNIVDASSHIFSGVNELGSIFSTESTIPVKDREGDPVVLSPKDVFARQQFGQLDNFPKSMAAWQESVAEAATADQNLAIYDSYQWTREVSRKVASGEISFIYPTPYTESIKDAIRTAHAKKNGILKYILFGEAGTGKTRLIQETDSENGRETVLINCHRFISFEELIGHAAITVDIGGNTTLDRLKGLAEQYRENGSPDQFWTDMTNVYEHLPPTTKQQYKDVEDMVDQFDPGVGLMNKDGDESTEEGRTEKRDTVVGRMKTGWDKDAKREAIRKRFTMRIKAAHDMVKLGLASEKDLPSKFVQGILLYCIENNKVPCFDEMDKAGPEGIESMLSFLSMSQGEVWRFQGGERIIPDDFYATATSNARNIGGMKDVVMQQASYGQRMELDEGMNRFLADRCEQITLTPQPVKDSLMIAAVNLSNENGDLLIDAREQVQLVNAFSYILPRLQKAGLPIPITNRIINTICSRLVEVKKDSEHTYYQRVSNLKSGEKQTVAEAIELSVLHLKGASLGTQGEQKVREVMHSYLSLVENQEIPSFGDDLMVDVPDSRIERYADMASKIWESPLYKAISLLQSDPFVLSRPKLRKVESSFLPGVNFDTLFARTPSFETRRLGCQNGIILEPTEKGIIMRSQIDPSDQDEPAVGIKNILIRNYENAQIVAADQLGERFVVRHSNGSQELGLKGNVTGAGSDFEYFIDPLGRYLVKKEKGSTLSVRLIEGTSLQGGVDIARNGELVDVSPNGNLLVYKENEQLVVVDLSMYTHGDNNFRKRVLTYPGWSGAKFLGNGMLVGVNEEGQLAKQDDGEVTVIAVS